MTRLIAVSVVVLSAAWPTVGKSQFSLAGNKIVLRIGGRSTERHDALRIGERAGRGA